MISTVRDVKLEQLPFSMRKWKTLLSYREDWVFLPYTVRSRIAEHEMIIDYLISLEEWLQPKLTIEMRQRVLIVQLIAAICEAVLCSLVDLKLRTKSADDKTFDRVLNSSFRYKPGKRTFKPTLELSRELSLISEPWASKLDHLVKIRNWIHLTNEEENELMNWIMDKSSEEHKKLLIDFRKYILTTI